MKVNKSKFIKAMLVLLAGAAVLFVAVFTMDEALHPDIGVTIEEYNTQHSVLDNGSVYQLGMWAGKGASPYDVGLNRIEQYKVALKAANNVVVNLTYDDNTADNRIKKLYSTEQKPPLLCDFSPALP